jgi:acyl-CoA synthetase (NDP forming)/RimJ/RimL family protein N-acetyltransferase
MDEAVEHPTVPDHWAVDVVLSDGGTLHVRPIRPDDADRLREFHSRLSPEAIYYRFFTPMPRLSDTMVERLVNVDYFERMAIVAQFGEQLVAVARYDLIDSDRAEVAFVVNDAHQGRGLGMLLLEHLVVIGRANGIGRFQAQTLSDNQAMLRVFKGAGFEVKRKFDGGVVEVEFSIAATEKSEELSDQRDRKAVANSIRRLLHPKSVAVIGAGREPGTVGHELVRHLLDGRFNGPVFPVNPNSESVRSVHTFPSISAVPIDVDLAVIAVPASQVAAVVQECADKGVTGLLIVSSGFAETGPSGQAAEQEIVELARRNGMRVIGPNSMGVVNTDPEISLNATFAPARPHAGRVGFMSQSGALGIALLAESDARQLGVSTFVAAGNKADVSGNDMLQYWELDERTDVILLYLETFGNPRRFTKIARRAARSKPIVAVKAGRTSPTRSAASHTAALVSPHVVADSVLRQAGVTRVDTLEQLFDVAQAFANQPLPLGRRLAIVGNATGPGVLAADAARSAGLEMAQLSGQTLTRLSETLPGIERLSNPVDIGSRATGAEFEAALRIVLEDESVDGLIAVSVPPISGRGDEMVAAIAAAAAAHPGKTMLANVLAGPASIGIGGVCVPTYRFPEGAAHAFQLMVERAEWLARPIGTYFAPTDEERDSIRSLIDEHLVRQPDGGWLSPGDARAFALAVGLPVLASALALTPEEASLAAERIGFPVAVKGASPELSNRAELGALHLGASTPDEVRSAATAMIERLGADTLGGLIVQPMLAPGLDLIAGITTDQLFGPLVVFGLGGVRAELLLDRTLHSAPLTDDDAHRMIRELRTSPLLFGFRGAPPVDTEQLESLLIRLGWLADEFAEIVELDLNPLITGPEGALAVDFRVRLEPPVPHPERALRSLL